jgi:hypothetical protein
VAFSSCSRRSVTLGLWWRMRRARRRDEAEKPDEAELHEEKKEPGENSSDSRRERGDVVDVEEVLEGYAALREGEKAVLRRRRKPAPWRGGVMD